MKCELFSAALKMTTSLLAVAPASSLKRSRDLQTHHAETDGVQLSEHLGAFRAGNTICITTFAHPADPDFVRLAQHNHMAYAERHNYTYAAFDQRISGHRFRDESAGDQGHRDGGGLVWQKLVALAEADGLGGRSKHCAWTLWMDTDAIFTQPAVRVEDLIEAYVGRASPLAQQRHLFAIVSRGETNYTGNFLNTGVLLVKNDIEGEDFLRAWERLYPAYQKHLFAEQDALHEYAFGKNTGGMTVTKESRDALEEDLISGLVLVPQRAFNSFVTDRFHGHEEAAKAVLWQPCDYIAHAAGMSFAARSHHLGLAEQRAQECQERQHAWPGPIRVRLRGSAQSASLELA